MAEEQKAQQDRTSAKAVADTLVREPIMITLPLAIALSNVLWKLLPGALSTSTTGALGASFFISLLVWLADFATSPPASGSKFTHWARLLVYVSFNTLLVAGLLTELISTEAIGL